MKFHILIKYNKFVETPIFGIDLGQFLHLCIYCIYIHYILQLEF